MRLVSVERTHDTYVARDENGIAWTVELPLDMRATPFREEAIWPAASVVAIGGGPEVHFLAAESGALVHTIALGDDYFGHFSPADGDMLYILGWRNVIALDASLAVRWIHTHLAVDGIAWNGQEGDQLLLSAEMDPPGGWVDVELDARTGQRLQRH